MNMKEWNQSNLRRCEEEYKEKNKVMLDQLEYEHRIEMIGKLPNIIRTLSVENPIINDTICELIFGTSSWEVSKNKTMVDVVNDNDMFRVLEKMADIFKEFDDVRSDYIKRERLKLAKEILGNDL